VVTPTRKTSPALSDVDFSPPVPPSPLSGSPPSGSPLDPELPLDPEEPLDPELPLDPEEPFPEEPLDPDEPPSSSPGASDVEELQAGIATSNRPRAVTPPNKRPLRIGSSSSAARVRRGTL